MEQAQLEVSQLREIVKSAVVETVQQQRELGYDAVREAFEETAMANAIREGDRSDFVPRSEIFVILENTLSEAQS